MFNNRITWQIALISAVILSLAYIFSTVLTYIIIALVIATILGPVVNLITRFTFLGIRVPRAAAVLLSFLMLIGVITLAGIVFVPLVSEQVQLMSKIDYQSIVSGLREPVTAIEQFLIDNNFTSEDTGFLMEPLQQTIVSDVLEYDFTNIITFITQTTIDVVIGILAIAFISFFFLYEKGLLKKALIRMIPNAYFELSITAMFQIEHLLSNYLIGLLVEILAIFSMISIGLTIIGIPYALTIGLFAAIAHVIPYFGAFLGTLFGITIGLSTAQSGMGGEAYLILALQIFLIHTSSLLIDNIFIQPLVFGRSVHAHPLEIFIIIFIGAALAGPGGMILAIPAYTVIRVTLTQLYVGYKQYTIFNASHLQPRINKQRNTYMI